ncbi:hypothetical protein UlMin_030680 [Ulmus minor]
MARSLLLFSLFLLSLVLISSANDYESHDNFQNQFHDQPTENNNFLPTDFLGHPLPNVFAIQGHVLCYSGSTYFPLQVKYLNVEGCKTYLEYSPLESCKFPTDVNNGIIGDVLSSTQILQDKSLLYSVGPFIYTSKPYDHSNIPNDYPIPNPNDLPIPTPNDDVPVPSKNTTPNGY